MMVGGSNGPYRLQILTNGQMAIFDGTHKANMKSVNTYRDMGRYMEGEFIYLSNIRYPVSKGNSFRRRADHPLIIHIPCIKRINGL